MRRHSLPLALSATAIVLTAACSSGGGGRATTAPQASPPPAASTRASEPPPPVVASAPEPASPVADYRDVIKLYRANIAEDFIIERIRADQPNYALNADQIIELRNSGISERVIQAMLESGKTGASAATMAAPSVAPAVAPRRQPEDMPPASMTWEGVVRRNSGIVVPGRRWANGTLSYAEGSVRWIDAKDSSKNLFIPDRSVSEHFMTCLKKAGGNECFEWGFRTKSGDEYTFRDVAWEQSVDDKPLAIHQYFKTRFPSLVDSNRPVEEK